MPRQMVLDHAQRVALVTSLKVTTHATAKMLVNYNAKVLADVDCGLATGAAGCVQSSVGCDGPLGLTFQAVKPAGSTYELATINAPPTEKPFGFAAPQ